MQIFFPKEEGQEIRATILPEVAKKFVDLGLDVVVEEGLEPLRRVNFTRSLS